jgi:hypothetical protein
MMLKSKRNNMNKTCSSLSGKRNSKWTKKLKGSNSSSTEKETSNLSSITLLKKNSEMYNRMLKSQEIENSFIMLLLVRMHSLILKRQKRPREDKKSSNFKSTTNRVRTTNRLTKNLLMNLCKLKLNVNIK